MKIAVLNTGGTFSSVKTENGLAPMLSGEELKKEIGSLGEETELAVEDFCSLDSSNILPGDWQKIAHRIEELADSCDGIIIIHGTDTMAYTASMLSFMVQNPPLPIVLTGSQIPLKAPMSDAVENFHCAVKMAESGLKGIFLAFDRSVMLGCRASKVRSMNFHAFESINYPEVGYVNALGLHISRERIPCYEGDFCVNTRYSDKIAVLKVFPGMGADIFTFLKNQGYEGIFIEGFGLGGLPFIRNDILRGIQKASEEGIPILVGSQCRYDGSDLNIYEAGRYVLESGGIPVYDMTQEAVVTKLMWCLGQTKDRDKIQAYFQRDMVHEITLPRES